MWYIVNDKNQVIATCDNQPDENDLSTRNEKAVETQENIPLLRAGYDGKNVIELSE